MANDKISAMTAAVGGNLAGSTTRFEITTLYTTVPATLGCTLALLRTTMFAGGSGYTAADPLTVGAITASDLLTVTKTTQQLSLKYDGSNHLAVTVASNGAVAYNATGAGAAHTFSDAVTCSSTLLSTGDFTVGSSAFVVTAATGAVAASGTATISTAGGYQGAFKDTTAFAAGVGGRIGFYGKYDSGANSTIGGAVLLSKSNATDGNYAFDLILATRASGSGDVGAALTLFGDKSATFASSLAITGALTGVTSATLSAGLTIGDTFNLKTAGAAGYISWDGSDNTVFRAATGKTLSMGGNNAGQLLLSGGLVTVVSGADFKLGAAASASVATASTHKIAIKDNTGTTYYALVTT